MKEILLYLGAPHCCNSCGRQWQHVPRCWSNSEHMKGLCKLPRACVIVSSMDTTSNLHDLYDASPNQYSHSDNAPRRPS